MGLLCTTEGQQTGQPVRSGQGKEGWMDRLISWTERGGEIESVTGLWDLQGFGYSEEFEKRSPWASSRAVPEAQYGTPEWLLTNRAKRLKGLDLTGHSVGCSPPKANKSMQILLRINM